MSISIHAPREGGDEAAGGITVSLEQFQSTPPARGATKSAWSNLLTGIFQSTPPARGATAYNSSLV